MPRDPRRRRHQRQPDRVAGHRRRLRPPRRRARRLDADAHGGRPRFVGLGRPHALDGQRPLRPAAVQHGDRVALRDRVRVLGAVPLPAPLGRFHLMDAIKADDLRLEPRPPRRTLLRHLLPAPRPDRPPPVLRHLDARPPPCSARLRVGAGRPNGRARLAPQLPPDWPRAAVRGLRAGNATLDVEIEQRWTTTGGEQRIRFASRGAAPEIDFVPNIPVGATRVVISQTGGGGATLFRDDVAAPTRRRLPPSVCLWGRANPPRSS